MDVFDFKEKQKTICKECIEKQKKDIKQAIIEVLEEVKLLIFDKTKSLKSSSFFAAAIMDDVTTIRQKIAELKGEG